MRKYVYDRDRINEAIPKSTTYSEVLEYLGIPTRGGNIETLKRIIEQMGVDTSHFTGRRVNDVTRQYYILSDKYIESGRRIQSSKLLEKLVRENKKCPQCEKCGIVDWNGKAIVFHLHHLDGNPENNNLDNLQVLCPNCHSQTNNYKGKANTRVKQTFYCTECGKEVKSKACRCRVCASKHRKPFVIIPKTQLESDLVEHNYNICAIARKYGLSDNAIRKSVFATE